MAESTLRCSPFSHDRFLSMKLLPTARMMSATSMGGVAVEVFIEWPLPEPLNGVGKGEKLVNHSPRMEVRLQDYATSVWSESPQNTATVHRGGIVRNVA